MSISNLSASLVQLLLLVLFLFSLCVEHQLIFYLLEFCLLFSSIVQSTPLLTAKYIKETLKEWATVCPGSLGCFLKDKLKSMDLSPGSIPRPWKIRVCGIMKSAGALERPWCELWALIAASSLSPFFLGVTHAELHSINSWIEKALALEPDLLFFQTGEAVAEIQKSCPTWGLLYLFICLTSVLHSHVLVILLFLLGLCPAVWADFATLSFLDD